jgi:hypothetical protein
VFQKIYVKLHPEAIEEKGAPVDGYAPGGGVEGCRLRRSFDEQRIDELLTDLADARAAERISADAATALRHELDLRRVRPGWWRRWFG